MLTTSPCWGFRPPLYSTIDFPDSLRDPDGGTPESNFTLHLFTSQIRLCTRPGLDDKSGLLLGGSSAGLTLWLSVFPGACAPVACVLQLTLCYQKHTSYCCRSHCDVFAKRFGDVSVFTCCRFQMKGNPPPTLALFFF